MAHSDLSNNAKELDRHKSSVLEQEATTLTPVETQPSNSPHPPRKNRLHKLILLMVLGAGTMATGVFGYRWWQYASTHVETDNAYVTGHVHPINARISGTVTKVPVNDNQIVSAGDLLVKLDPRDYEVALQQAQAALEVARQQAEVAQGNINVVATNAQGQTTQAQGNIDAAVASISTSEAAVTEAQAGVPAAQAQQAQVEANLVKAELDYKRYDSLAKEGAVPRQQFDNAKANYEANLAQRNAVKEQVQQAQARLTQTQKSLNGAQAKLASTRGSLQQAEATGKQTEVNRRQYKAALAAIAQSEAQLKNAQLQLSYTNITAPTEGQVGNKTVEVGQRVQPGQTLMAIVQQQPWIIANFKETQLAKMKSGQPVEIKIDAFGKHTFEGKVESVSPASGAKFALLPPDNATGNFTKIVQRVPVKIVFEPKSIRGYESRITPGMSAVVNVEVTYRQ